VSSVLYRLGRLAAQRRRTVLAVWLVVLVLACGGALFNKGTDDTFEIPGTQSQDALDYLTSAIAVAVAVTLVPALMAFAWERLRPKAASVKLRRRQSGPGRISRFWVRLATRVPLLTVVVVVAGLAVCALPAADLRLALPDNGTEEEGSPARDTYEVVSEHFGPGYNGPLIVTADIITSTEPVGVVNKIADELSRLPGVASAPLATPNPKADTGIIQVVPAAAPDSAETETLAKTIRGLRCFWCLGSGKTMCTTVIRTRRSNPASFRRLGWR
jgi:putative drug exporter of the RND superfamily